MLRKVFILLFGLLAEPIKNWSQLAEQKEEKDNENFYRNYLYPIFGIIVLLSFIGALLSAGKFDVQAALKAVIKQIAIYFGGFYMASFVMSEFVMPRFKGTKETLLTERFVGYSSAMIYVVAMAQSLIPSMSILLLIDCYSIYIIWVGATRYLGIDEDDLAKFMGIASAVVLLSPAVITLLIQLLIPGMK